jgi:hypothetical protein
MSRIGDWFRRLRGHAVEESATPPPARPMHPVHPAHPGRPKPARTPAPAAPAADVGLSIDEEPRPASSPSRVGETGFDPYSSDAGYQKPHSWERVDHD